MATHEPIPGNSDQDREAWLGERRGGVTASEIAAVVTGRKTIAGIGREKAHGVDRDLSGIPAIQWGVDREPIIAEVVRQQTGIQHETRVFHHPTVNEYMASPDGVGEDFDGRRVLCEIKTSGKNIAPGTGEFAASGYMEQMQWAMHVMGASKCLYVWEQRLDGGDGYEPGELNMEWIDYDPDRVGQLVRAADSVLTASANAHEQGDDIDEELDALAGEYAAARAVESAGKARKKTAQTAIISHLEGRPEYVQESETVRVLWKPETEVEQEVPDFDAAVEADPELWARLQAVQAEWEEHAAQYVKTTSKTVRASITVTDR